MNADSSPLPHPPETGAMRVSIIIVSWNARNHLRNCLNSIREHAGNLGVETLVIDNDSSDGSPEMVETEYPEVMLIRAGGNLGFARANNLGIQKAKGDYLALVNSDVILHPRCLHELVEFLDREPSVGLAGPRVLGSDGKLQPSCRRLPSMWNTLCQSLSLHRLFPGNPTFGGRELRGWNHDEQADVEVLSGCFWMARRKAVEQIGGLDERFFFYAEDIDWCKRFRDAGWRVVLQPAATATHFGGGSSANAPLKYSIELHRANLAYWQKHHGPVGRTFYFLISVFHHLARLTIRAVALATVRRKDPETVFKLKRSWACLRWLVLGTRP